MMTVQNTLLKYFRELLIPRNQGAIAIAEMFPAKKDPSNTTGPPRRRDQRGFIVCLGHDPFLEVVIGDVEITLHIGYPRAIAAWDDKKKEWQVGCGEIEKLPGQF